MNTQQLAAYEALCAKVPEARHPTCYHRKGLRAGLVWTGGGGDYGPMNGADVLAILTAHLEAMLPLGKWGYINGIGYTIYGDTQDGPFGPERNHRLVRDADDFVALCKAVESTA